MDVKKETRKIADYLVQNPSAVKDFEESLTAGIKEKIDEQIDSLISLQDKIGKITGNVQALTANPKKPKKTTSKPKKPASKKEPTKKVRKIGKNEAAMKALIADPAKVVEATERLYGLAESQERAAASMWFKSTDFLSRWFAAEFHYPASLPQLNNLQRNLHPVFHKMEKKGKIIRRGFARHTRWLMLK